MITNPIMTSTKSCPFSCPSWLIGFISFFLLSSSQHVAAFTITTKTTSISSIIITTTTHTAVTTKTHRRISLLLLQQSQNENNDSSTSSDYERNYSNVLKRRNVQLPLLDMSSSLLISSQDNGNDSNSNSNNKNDEKPQEETTSMIPIVPLPASHLPDELATLQIYGMQLRTGMHKVMMKDITTLSATSSSSSLGSIPVSTAAAAVSSFDGDLILGGDEDELFPVFGYVVKKGQEEDDWKGAIGCAANVIFVMDEKVAESDNDDELNDSGIVENDNDSLIVLCKGSYRFIVKDMLQTFPYPIAIVDELLDEEPVGDSAVVTTVVKEYNDFQDEFVENDDEEDEDDDDDGNNELITIDSSELIPRTMAAMKTLVDQKLNTNRPSMTPLEEAILKESGRDPSLNVEYLEKNRAEEMAAILDIFSNSLLDIAPTKMERLYVVAIMAAEFAGLDNEMRRKILTMVDGVARLRLVLAEAEKKISLVQAKKITQEIMQKNDEGSRELQVGVPSLPPWAKSIKKGMKIEYFWNEIEGWCKGEVIENPVMVLDELIVTVRFEDGDIEKLPFRADEKARWRPGGMGR